VHIWHYAQECIFKRQEQLSARPVTTAIIPVLSPVSNIMYGNCSETVNKNAITGRLFTLVLGQMSKTYIKQNVG
jgi:hypothetical protein